MRITKNLRNRAIAILTGLVFGSYSDSEALKAVLQALLDELDSQSFK